MEIKAKGKYLRMSDIKLTPVAKLIRGKSVTEAKSILQFKVGKAAELIEQVLGSASANAENNKNLNPDHLYVKHISIEQGPTLKRWRAGARGGVAPILKRTSHINIILDESEDLKKAFPDKRATKAKDEKKETKKVDIDEALKEKAADKKDEKSKDAKSTTDKKVTDKKATDKKEDKSADVKDAKDKKTDTKATTEKSAEKSTEKPAEEKKAEKSADNKVKEDSKKSEDKTEAKTENKSEEKKAEFENKEEKTTVENKEEKKDKE